MPGREGRVHPFERDDARRVAARLAPRLHLLADGAQPPAERLDQRERRVLRFRHRADGGDRVEDPLDRVRLEGDDRDVRIDGAGDLVDLAVAHRTDGAQLLGQDQVRIERRQRALVERVQRRAAMDGRGDEPVDVALGRAGQVVGAARDDGLADDLGRIVALVRDADELIAETDRADDLGGGREE